MGCTALTLALAALLAATLPSPATAGLSLGIDGAAPAADTVANVDCSGTGQTFIDITFTAPADMPDCDVAWVQVRFDVVAETYPFWNFEHSCVAGFGVVADPPGSDHGPWHPFGAWSTHAVAHIFPNEQEHEYVGIQCVRNSAPVEAGDSLFFCRLYLPMPNPCINCNPYCTGCSAPVTVSYVYAEIAGESGQKVIPPGNGLHFNQGVVAARRTSWGALKAMYR